MTDDETTPSAASRIPVDTELELSWGQLMHLLNMNTSRTTFWQVADLLDSVELTDEEVDALLKMPAPYRQSVTAAFLEYAETIREGSRTLDGQLLRLTGELV